MIFGFKSSPKKRILNFFRKNKKKEAVDLFISSWEELKVIERFELLNLWADNLDEKSDKKIWISYVEKHIQEGGELEDFEDTLKKNIDYEYIFDYKTWIDFYKVDKRDFWLVLASANKIFPIEKYSLFLKKKIDPLVFVFLSRRLESEKELLEEHLPFLKGLVKEDKDDFVKFLYVEYLFKKKIWETKNLSLFYAYLSKKPLSSDISDWVCSKLKPPLSDKWFDLVKKITKEDPCESNKKLLTRCCVEKGVYLDFLEDQIAELGLKNKRNRFAIAKILLSSKKPKKTTIKLFCLAVSEGFNDEALLALIVQFLESESLLNSLISEKDLNEDLIKLLFCRWEKVKPTHFKLILKVIKKMILIKFNFSKKDFKLLSSIANEEVAYWASFLAISLQRYELLEMIMQNLNKKSKVYFDYKLNLHFQNKKYDFSKKVFDFDWAKIDSAVHLESVSDVDSAQEIYEKISDKKTYAGVFSKVKRALSLKACISNSDFKKLEKITNEPLGELLFLNGIFYSLEGNWAKCEEFFKKGYQETNDSRFLTSLIEVYFRWSSKLLEDGRFSQAEKVVEKSLMLQDDIRILKNWILTIPKASSWNKLKNLNMDDLDESFFSEYFWLAWRAGDYEKSDLILKKCLSSSDSELFIKRIARYYLELPMPEEEGLKSKIWQKLHSLNRPWLTTAIAISQEEEAPYPRDVPKGIEKLLTGWSLLKNRQFETAQFHFLNLLNGPPRNLGTGIKRGRAHVVLGYCLLCCGDFKSAEEAWQRSSHFGISNSLINTLKFVLELEKGVDKSRNKRNPLKNYVKALNHPLTKDSAQKNLAIHFTFEGDFINAGKYWDSLLENFSGKKNRQEKVWLDISTQMSNYCHKAKQGGNLNLIEIAALEDEVENIKKQLKSYRDLGVDPGVTEEELEVAYFKRIKNFTPEKNPQEFRRIEEARQFIADPDLRLRTELFTQSGLDRDKLSKFLSFYESNPLDFFVDLPAGIDCELSPGFFEGSIKKFPKCKNMLVESILKKCRIYEPFEVEDNLI